MTPGVSRRIYELSQEVLEFQRAAQPLTGILAAITAGFDKYGVDEELRSYLRDVADHVTQVNERVEGFRLQLRDILTVNATLVAQRQNEEIRELTEASIAQGEEVKKISAWAAILFAPTLVGTVYGMNFDAHAGAALAPRLPVRAAADGRGQRRRCTWSSSGATGSERGDRLGGRAGASSGCPAAPSCAAGGSGDAATPADFTLVLADGPVPDVAAPAGAVARLLGADGHRATPLDALHEARRRAAAGERVEVACRGGVGRTGTALAALAVLDGLTPGDAVHWVRAAYHRRAVETPWQRWWLRRRPLRTPPSGGTRPGPEPLRCLHNYTGGEWSRLRSGDQGKRAEEGNDELVNHPLQNTQAPIPISATRPRCLTAARRVCQPGFVIDPDPGIS